MLLKTIIQTMRHGNTSFNSEKRYAGKIDIPLSEKGIADCKAASLKLSGIAVDVVITSTMQRSVETAHLLLPGGPSCIQSALCNERNFGIMEGHTWDEIRLFDPPILMIEVGKDFHTVNPKGSEPFEDVWQRAKKFHRFLFSNFQGKNILVISHGVFLQMFHGLLRGLSCIESLAVYPANLELYRFTFLGRKLDSEELIKLTDTDNEIRF